MWWWTVPDRLLIRHFLQRFLDHDLISPHADRRTVLASAAAGVVSLSLFLAVLVAVKYQFNMFLPPGLTAMASLDDRFLLITLGMLLAGLVAVAFWDALALDARDTAILGALPLRQATIVRAKFAAVAVVAIGVMLAWTVPLTLLRVVALPPKLRVSWLGVGRLTLAHGVASITAMAFAFLVVLSVREGLRALAGHAVFMRVSAGVQAALIGSGVSALLLVPGASSHVAARWWSGQAEPTWTLPPLWFLGLHEWLAGAVIEDLPRGALHPSVAKAEQDATTLYRAASSHFEGQATLAIVACGLVAACAVAVCAWNHRQLPVVASTRAPRRSGTQVFLRLVAAVVARHPLTRAAFFFTIQTFSRSAIHRIALASSLALGVSVGVVLSGGARLTADRDLAAVPLRAWAAQTLVLATVVVGIRRAAALPVHLPANWVFRMAWRGDVRPYTSGVKRASMIAVLGPVLLAGLLWQGQGFNAALATAHAFLGLLLALLLTDAAFLPLRKPPFVCAYVPSQNVAGMSLIIAVPVVMGAFIIAAVERAVIGHPRDYLILLAVLVAACVTLRVAGTTRVDGLPEAAMDDGLDLPTQRLDLAG